MAAAKWVGAHDSKHKKKQLFQSFQNLNISYQSRRKFQ